MDGIVSRPICVIDIETTGLDPYTRQAWEFACIRREPDGGHSCTQFFIDVDLDTADPKALEIGGYYTRDRQSKAVPPEEAVRRIVAWTQGCTIVGAQPQFDTITLERLLHDYGTPVPWHYRLRCVESLAAGFLRRADLGGLAGCAQALGIEVPPGAAHTAMGDCETAMAIYEMVLGERQ
jgi:DNA polymerase-3 subunit epsilon